MRTAKKDTGSPLTMTSTVKCSCDVLETEHDLSCNQANAVRRHSGHSSERREEGICKSIAYEFGPGSICELQSGYSDG